MSKGRKILFFDVDTQNDFINPDGALYVPGADQLKGNFRLLIEYARSNLIPVWGSVDAHLPDDPELVRNKGAFPDHCMLGEAGKEKIIDTKPLNPLWVSNRVHRDEEIEKIRQHGGEVYFQKRSFNVFDNPAVNSCVSGFGLVIVFGVATDYCVRAAVLGFRKLGVDTVLVIDAIKSVDIKEDDGKKALDEMSEAGARFVTTNEILRGEI